MKNTLLFLLALPLAMISHSAISQQITEPQMSATSFDEAEVINPPDGRTVRRVGAATTGLIHVEWPEGTTTTPHNHANELVMTVLEGRLRAMSGEQEFIMEAGDIVIIPAWVEHSYTALEDTITLEAFGPG